MPDGVMAGDPINPSCPISLFSLSFLRVFRIGDHENSIPSTDCFGVFLSDRLYFVAELAEFVQTPRPSATTTDGTADA
jgi:hypothetical protein